MIGFPLEAVNTDLRPPAGVSTEGKVDASRIEDNVFEQVNGRCFDLDGFHDGEVANNSCVNRGDASVYPNGGYGLYLDNGSAEMRSQMVNIHDNRIEGMPWGGVFVVGTGHRVVNNKLLRLNLLGCSAETREFNCLPNADEPLLSRAGIYLGLRGQRPDPADAVLVEGNEVSGAGMGSGNCVVFAPQVKPTANTVKDNDCKN
jgi:hypothetical protein